ncbi:MAG: Crp/Fnr family transcriptional regulator [Tsuneonella sp.]
MLTDRETDAVLALPTWTMEVAPNHDFVRLGEQVDQACLVVAGLVGRFDQNAKGARQITALHVPGDMPDLHSVMQPRATSALQALTTTTILKVPHRALREVAAAYPAIAEALWRDTMVDSMITAQWVVNVGRRDAESRIAHLLCEMACRYGVGSTGAVVFKLPMTQQQLADATGLTPVHVNRCLQKLKASGISVRNRTVRVDSWDALVALGDFDRGYLQDEMLPEDRIRIAPLAA